MINASIVTYETDPLEVLNLISIFDKSDSIKTIFVVDNSKKNELKNSLENVSKKVHYIHNPSNSGYGAGHNIAIEKSLSEKIDFHLVLNADTDFDYSIIEGIEGFMIENKDIGLLSPKVLNKDGSIQYSSRLIPNPFLLFFRAFFPRKFRLKQDYNYQLKKFEYNKIFLSCYVSGCFMFFRCTKLKEIGIFDERFFMYPEDLDITRRFAKSSKVIFHPDFEIIHNYEGASHKSFKMFLIHSINMIKYFNKWGWFYDPERKRLNFKISNQFDK